MSSSTNENEMKKPSRGKKPTISVEINPEIEGEAEDSRVQNSTSRARKHMKFNGVAQHTVAENEEELSEAEAREYNITSRTSNRTLGQLKARKDEIGRKAREEIRRRQPMTKHTAAHILRKHLRGDKSVGIHAATAAAVVGKRKAAQILHKITQTQQRKAVKATSKSVISSRKRQRKIKAATNAELSAAEKTINQWREGIGLNGEISIEAAQQKILANPPTPEVEKAIETHFKANELKFRRKAFAIDDEIRRLEKTHTRIGTKVHEQKLARMQHLRDQFHLDNLHMSKHFHGQYETAMVGHNDKNYVKTRFAKILNSPTYQVMAMHHGRIGKVQNEVERQKTNATNKAWQDKHFASNYDYEFKTVSAPPDKYYVHDPVAGTSHHLPKSQIKPHHTYMDSKQIAAHQLVQKQKEKSDWEAARAAQAKREAEIPWYEHPAYAHTGPAIMADGWNRLKGHVKRGVKKVTKKNLKESIVADLSKGIRETEFQKLVRMINEKQR